MKKILFILLCIAPMLIQAQVSGCSDPSAANYYCNTPAGAATDGTGCVMTGFNPMTGPIWSLPPGFTDDGSCIIAGCTNSSADNYNSSATFDDGSCMISGCMDDGQQSWSVTPGSPACNYNSSATTSDNSCS